MDYSVAVSQFLCLMSLKFASTKVAAIVAIVTPFVIHILNLIRRKENLSIMKLIGFFIASAVAALVRIFMFDDPFHVHPTSSNWEVLWGILLCLASSLQLQAWVTNYIEDKMTPSCGDSFAVKTMICFFGTIFLVAMYCILPDHGVGNGNTKPNDMLMMRVILMIAINSVTQAGAIWCVQRKGTSYLAAFPHLSPFASTVAAPFISESHPHPVGMIVTCGFIFMGGRLVKKVMTVEAEAASQETYISSGNHQGEGIQIELLESQLPQLNTAVKTIDDEPQRIETFIYQQEETSLIHHPKCIDLESSNTMVESVIDIIKDTGDQGEEINHGDQGGGIEGTGMDSGHEREPEPCEATDEPGASNTVEEIASDEENEEVNHDDDGGGIQGARIDSGHEGGGLGPREVT